MRVEGALIVPTMRKRLDRIRFRGQKRDDFADLAESPNTSDTECSEEIVIKCQSSLRDSEELRDVDGGEQQSDSQVRVKPGGSGMERQKEERPVSLVGSNY